MLFFNVEYLPPIEETIASGCLPKFIEFLTAADNKLQVSVLTIVDSTVIDMIALFL